MLDSTRDALAHLIDEKNISGFQTPSQRVEDDHKVIDDETYLKEMEIDSNWQIPREKTEITREKLGRVEFGTEYTEVSI